MNEIAFTRRFERDFRRLVLALVLTAPAIEALAWGAEGHRMVGNIAAQLLTPQAAQRVLALLANDRLADGSPSGRTTLGEVAYWSDEIKDYPWGKRAGSWHFDDVPVCGVPDPDHYCKGGNCASAQIARHVELLKSPRATRRQKNEALKWVVHLVGDIHQPLHAANRHDRGGNLVQVSFFGQRDNPPYGTINLHTIWDVHMVQRLISEKGGEASFVSAPIGESERRRLEDGDVATWISESTQIARTTVYSVIPGHFSCGGKIHDVLEIGEAYYVMAAPIVEAQIRKAGVRLARVLNEALGP